MILIERGTFFGPRSITLREDIGTVLRVTSPAKVNLFLGVGATRPDGYHELTSVFHALELADEIAFEPADRLVLHCDTDLGLEPHHNLAYRAAVAFGLAMGHEPHVALTLTKRIPHGAGLGGGSSNAAAVIAGLATLWGIDPHDPRCASVAESLGADAAFFLIGGAALMVGKGHQLACELPALTGVPVALVMPPLSVSTVEAYRAFDASPVPAGDPGAVVAALEAGDVAALADALENNLEHASVTVVPEVADALAWVRTAPGVLGALVAGSGSAVFALCSTEATAVDIAEAAAGRGWWGSATRLVAYGAEVIGEG